MASEATQAGNPHKLTKKQHIFPVASIARFGNENGRVSVIRKSNGKRLSLSPTDPIFCVRRRWNQAAESGYMKAIEDKFQTFVGRVLCGHTIFTEDEHQIVSHFYALCRLRAEVGREAPADREILGFQSDSVMDKNTEEILERNGYAFPRGNIWLSRHQAAIYIQVGVSRLVSPDTRWGLIRSSEVDFLVPDSFGELGAVPLSPHACFIANCSNATVTSQNAIEINAMAYAVAQDYCFARNFSSAVFRMA